MQEENEEKFGGLSGGKAVSVDSEGGKARRVFRMVRGCPVS
jgi:hypothetical protein